MLNRQTEELTNRQTERHSHTDKDKETDRDRHTIVLERLRDKKTGRLRDTQTQDSKEC